jgi:Flp pilus assembly secretin CpaC
MKQISRVGREFGSAVALWAMVALGWVGSAGASEIEKSPGILGMGEQRLWTLPEGIAKFAVGGPALRVASVQARTLVIRGAAPGIADLRVWKKDGSTELRTFQVERAPSSLGLPPALLRGLSGLQETEVWAWAQGGIILRGETQTVTEAARIRALARLYPKEIHDETLPSETLTASGLTRLNEWIQAHSGWASFTCERQGRDLWVRGHAANPSRISRRLD